VPLIVEQVVAKLDCNKRCHSTTQWTLWQNLVAELGGRTRWKSWQNLVVIQSLWYITTNFKFSDASEVKQACQDGFIKTLKTLKRYV
jgi:hypothetical protein